MEFLCRDTLLFKIAMFFDGLSEFYVKNDVSGGLSKLALASLIVFEHWLETIWSSSEAKRRVGILGFLSGAVYLKAANNSKITGTKTRDLKK